ncbi:arsenate reductase ArsC [Georgenia sp. SYP-B2076]|uniref:arsenate reductase ArsC n=1 Tax=Georgenia sp. SYP-B2076 TaxID=2495881 RepID=UPI000F8F30EA|nr:arsenate reductase ArsC [Georgenia sp. SYP-B2076]
MDGDKGLPGLSHPDHILRTIAAELAEKFAGTFSADMVERYVFESYAALARTARVSAMLPALAQKFATDRLTALAQSEGALPHAVPEVLFVCVENAGRSQMAAALLNRRAEGRVHARSAGASPIERVYPRAAEAMAELGVDMADAYPKPLTDDVVRAADVVITMSCPDACPVYAGKRYEDWELDDASEDTIEEARRIRNELDARVDKLLGQLPAMP